jgi:hypothetical protein
MNRALLHIDVGTVGESTTASRAGDSGPERTYLCCETTRLGAQKRPFWPVSAELRRENLKNSCKTRCFSVLQDNQSCIYLGIHTIFLSPQHASETES